MAIIGVSGKIASGKDTVGHIIQYLVYSNNMTVKINKLHSNPIGIYTLDDFLNNNPQVGDHIQSWKIRKFADKLKECASLILNIPREDLEKIEVKNKVLGEEWIRYGYADSFYRDMNGQPIMNNKQCSKEEYEKHYKTNWQTAYKHEYTVRDILQLLGTEVGRSIHNDFWVNALFSGYTQTAPNETVISKLSDGNNDDFRIGKMPSFPNWIVTDMRFPNELEAVKSRGGITIRVNRDLSHLYHAAIQNGDMKPSDVYGQHPSETALDNASFNYTIDNTGTIEELIEKVKEILIKEKII